MSATNSTKQKTLVLASQSPRRSEILKKAGYFFVPFPVHVSEIPDKNLSLNDQILDIARRKATEAIKSFTDESLDSVFLASDTMVCLNGVAFGKPESTKEAFEFLKLFSGRAHEVKTAVILVDYLTGENMSHIETTRVFFKNLSDSEIDAYIKTGEPMDKAGAYAIQGLGSSFVEKFDGDFNNVVGLPLHAIENIFKLKKWQFKRL